MVRRGDLWWLDLGDPVGSAPGYERPCVIISSDPFNKSKINTAIVVLLYSNLRLGRHAGNVTVPAAASGLDRDSVANVTQIGAYDHQQFVRRIGTLPPSLMREIDAGLRLALQL